MPVAVEVYADVLCPSAWVLLRQLVDQREASGATSTPIHVRAWPWELVTGRPPDLREVVARAVALRDGVAPTLFAALDDGLAAGPEVTSIPAMALTAAAYGRSSDSGESVALRLRELVFEEGVDVADPVVLGALEASLGLHVAPDPGLVQAEYELARHRGVTASPHLVGGSVNRTSPTFRFEERGGVLVAERTPDASEVLRACFAPADAPVEAPGRPAE